MRFFIIIFVNCYQEKNYICTLRKNPINAKDIFDIIMFCDVES